MSSSSTSPSSPSMFADFGLLRRNPEFLSVFIARTISLFGLGMLSVAVPMQIHQMSGNPLHIGTAMALEGAGMFIGLLLGGVLADRHERRRLILFARAVCGIGFLGLAVNAWSSAPSLEAVYLLAAWDGFFGALGVTALMACMPLIVGRENLLQARAVSMVSMRLATVTSPALAGALIAFAEIGWTYLIVAVATGLTLLPLLRLPRMAPSGPAGSGALAALAEGVRFMLKSPIIAATTMAGMLLTLSTAIRVLFPSLAEHAFGGGAFEVGLMYSAVPLGATLGALVSGWTGRLARPGLAMLLLCLGAFLCLMLLGLNHSVPLALLLLTGFGYLVSVASLLQYALVQGHTPDQYLGRVNGMWSAQDAASDSLGAVGIGLAGKIMSALTSVFALGAIAGALALMLLGASRALRNAPMEAVHAD